MEDHKMKKRIFYPLVMCLGIAQSMYAINPEDLSANDFTGDLQMEMEIKLPKWLIFGAQGISNASVKVGVAAIPHVGQIPFIPDVAGNLAGSITGIGLSGISIPLFIKLSDVKIRQYKNGLFTFKLEHIVSILDDQIDLRLQMPFIGCFLKDKAILKCTGAKIHLYLGDVLHIKNPVLNKKDQSLYTLEPVPYNGWIIANHIPGMIGQDKPTAFSVQSKIKINHLGSLPIKLPSLAILKINLIDWTLSKIKRLSVEKTSSLK